MYANIDIFEFDREFVNFSVSFPGESLTCEFTVKNISIIDACFEIRFSQQENLLKIFKKYYQSDIKEVFEEIPNSQVNFGCFSLSYFEENNNLCNAKKIRIFIKKGNFPSENFLLKNEKYFKYFMPILGSVEIPKLLCLKELLNEKAKFPFISLLLEIKSKGQKFRIPYKNFSLKDIEIELIFEKMPSNNTVFCFGGKFYECQFLCFPNKMTIPSHGICQRNEKNKKLIFNFF
jgi:hypothetical protein